MPRNRVQHQKGLSDDAFERLYPDGLAIVFLGFVLTDPRTMPTAACSVQLRIEPLPLA